MTQAAADRIIITDRSGAGEILCSPGRCATVAYLVSIGGPGDRQPAGFGNVAHRIRLVFEDAETQEAGGASLEDIRRLIGFARKLDLGNGQLLIHCQSGISRSTAAAVIALAVLLGPGREGDALNRIRRLHPRGRPNRRMLELAEAVLDLKGVLIDGY